MYHRKGLLFLFLTAVISILIVSSVSAFSFSDLFKGKSTTGKAVSDSPCPTSAQAQRGQTGSFSCYCSGASGTIWGTGTYTDDSNICNAAKHSGLTIPGSVTYTIASGQSSYSGTTQNGITSASYGSWAGSFTIGAGTTPPPTTTQSRPTITSTISPSTLGINEQASFSFTATDPDSDIARLWIQVWKSQDTSNVNNFVSSMSGYNDPNGLRTEFDSTKTSSASSTLATSF